MAQLILSSSAAHDAGTEKIHLAGGVTVFGRDEDCDVVLRDVHCSRRHIEIRSVGDAYVLRDLDSTNGVLLNGQRVVADCQLREGDVIELGMTRLCFEPDRLEKEPPATTVLPVVDTDGVPTEVLPRQRTMPRPARLQNTLAVAAMAALVAVIAGLSLQPMVRQRLPLRSKSDAADRPAADEEPHDPAAIAHAESAPASIAATPQRQPTRAPDSRTANTPATRRQPMPPGPATLENLLEQVPAELPTAPPTAAASRGNDQEAASRPPADQPAAPRLDAPKTSAAAVVARPPSDASAPSRPAAPPRVDTPGAGVEPPATAVTAERLAVPQEAEIEAEMQAIKKMFSDNFSEQADLSRVIAKIRSTDRQAYKPAKMFALLVTAEREAIQAALYRDAIDCLRLRADMFDVDELPARVDLLRDACEGTASPSIDVFELVTNTAFEAVRAERFDVALKAAHVAEKIADAMEQAARQQAMVSQPSNATPQDGRPVAGGGLATAMPFGPTGMTTLADAGRRVAIAQQLRKRILEAKRLRAKYVDACEELRESPHDKSASEIVGKYLCFVKEDWRAGISALAMGRSTVLGELASRELALGEAGSADPQAAFELAGDWWTLAERGMRSSGLPTGSSEAVIAHAAEIYGRILGRLSDPIEVALAESRIAIAKTQSESGGEDGEFDGP